MNRPAIATIEEVDVSHFERENILGGHVKTIWLALFVTLISSSALIAGEPFNAGMQEQIPATEYEALVALYNSTNGPGWTNHDGWLDPAAVYWSQVGVVGVEYDENGNVITVGHVCCLQLQNNNLVGSIPSTVGQLTEVDLLLLDDNHLTGSIPPELGQLTKLTDLDLSNSELTGSIPPELGQLVLLQALVLSNSLNASDKKFSGPIPAELGKLARLTDLSLDYNNLTGPIPSELGNLSELVGLYLNGNQLTGSIPATLGQLTQLSQLYLDSNQLSGSIPAELGQLYQLQGLTLYSNQLEGAIPAELGQLSQLVALFIGGNQLTGSIPGELGQLSQLQTLSLSDNQLTGSIPVELGQLSQLNGLDLSANQLTGPIPSALGSLANLGGLYLFNNELSGAIPSTLGNLTNLIELFLNDNQLTGPIPSTFGSLTNLSDLDLHSNKLSGTIPSTLGSLTNLSILDLSFNQFSGTIASTFAELTNLGYFNISYNELSLTDPVSLSVIKTLTDQGTQVLADPQNLPKITLGLLRCTPDGYSNLDGADIDSALVPVTSPEVLAVQPPVSEGLVADGVTPLLIKIDLNSTEDSDKAATYAVTLDAPTGGTLTGGIAAHLRVLQNGVFGTSTNFTFGDDSAAYAYITAINAADVQLGSSTELNVTMHVTSDADSSIDETLTFKIVKPPVVLVHGYASNSCTWSQTFLNVFTPSRPAGFVYAIDYGLPGKSNLVCPDPNGNAVGEPLTYAAFELDDVLATQVEDHDNGRFAGWAFTRYDLVCHSQGGVLARMLCQTFPGSIQGLGAPYSRTAVVSRSNANRGRFRRVVTIGSPQNGTTILHYISQLDQRLGSYSRLIPFSRDLLQSKFDPYVGQIPQVNSTYLVDDRIKFNSIRTKIGQSATPLSYKLLGLPSTPSGESRTRLEILLPQGSDGIVDYDSQAAGATFETDYLPVDISHVGPPIVFGVSSYETQTVSSDLAVKVQTLLAGPPTSFGKFVLPVAIPNLPSQAEVDSIAASLTVSDIVMSLFGASRNVKTLAGSSSGSTSYTCGITPAADDPPDGEISWYAENRSPNGVSTDGVTAVPDVNDPTIVMVTVDDSIVGDVVLYAQYMSQQGKLVLGDPLLVVSRPPAVTPTGIDLGQSSFVLSIGDLTPLQLYADYPGDVRMPQYVSVDETVGLQSSDPSIVDVDVDRTSLIAKAPGTATVTATFHGFSTQAAVTVGPLVPPPPQLLNISTRMQVLNGDNVLIGGFIVTGSEAKKVILRGIGPSLSAAGITGLLQDPYLELHNQVGIVASNENWKDTQQDDIAATGIPPANDKEAAIVSTLPPGAYTVILRQQNGGTGIGLVEAYDLDQTADSKLSNISTRGFVDVGDNVMIGGFIAGGSLGGTGKVLVRALGPSLASAGVAGALQDPTLELHDSNGDLLDTNDNWKDTQAADITATGIPPMDDRESAIVATLTGGAYTAIVRGSNGTTGVALVEAYQLDN